MRSKKNRKRKHKPLPAVSVCGDCGFKARIGRYHFRLAAPPRCIKCGGMMRRASVEEKLAREPIRPLLVNPFKALHEPAQRATAASNGLAASGSNPVSANSEGVPKATDRTPTGTAAAGLALNTTAEISRGRYSPIAHAKEAAN